jgi:DNA-binding winged helix-turn-helix (wHTH) protein
LTRARCIRTTDVVILAFGNIEIDPERRQLRVGGREFIVQPLVFDLLSSLARHPDALITKEALVRDGWHGVSVSDGTITQALSSLRRGGASAS